jgi:uncharacterized damage-inducible protein DinB
MDLTAYLPQLYDYHYWANHLVMAAARALPEEQAQRDLGHSWGSLHGILLHMMNSEWIWLRRWQGESPRAFMSPADFATLAAVQAYWVKLEVEVRLFISSQTAAALANYVTYTNTLNQTYTLPLWQMLVHVPNHATHHRGELAAMFAALAAPHPETDWLHYFLYQSGQRKFEA